MDVANASVMPPATGPSSAEDATILLDDVHVNYRVAGEHRPRLKDLLRGRRHAPEDHFRTIKAVHGVSLVALRGQAIGVIGRNGSGKSTLMRAMAGLLPVTSGEVYASSQPALLGVGAALKPSISGRRNIQLGGLALGMTRGEIEARMDEVIDFADLRDFIDLPLKAYSSGMKARLLFAISTAIRPEILLIDEALAVGDEIFRERSDERIQELIGDAGTVFIVTHSLGTVRETCGRAIWLEKGEMEADGDPSEVVSAYRRFVKRQR